MSTYTPANPDQRGNNIDRRRRRDYLMAVYASDVPGRVRCYRCGELLDGHMLTVDRIIPGCRGGRYTRDNIRPACRCCNSSTGALLRGTS